MTKKAAFVMVVAIVAAGMSSIAGYLSAACTKDCNKDVCLWRVISAISSTYIVDTRMDFAGNPIDCNVEYWADDSGDDYYGYNSGGFKNGRYCDMGQFAGPGCGSVSDRFYKVATFQCDNLNYDGNWLFSCYASCCFNGACR